MTQTTSAIRAFIEAHDRETLKFQDLEYAVAAISNSESLKNLLLALINSPAFSEELGKEFAAVNAIEGISACRSLRSCLNFTLSSFFGTLCELISAFDETIGDEWYTFANRVHRSKMAKVKLLETLVHSEQADFYHV